MGWDGRDFKRVINFFVYGEKESESERGGEILKGYLFIVYGEIIFMGKGCIYFDSRINIRLLLLLERKREGEGERF